MMKRKVFIGNYLRPAMEKAGLNQSELADIIESQQCVISKYVSNETVPTATALLLLSRALNCSIDYLVTGKDYEKSRGHWEKHVNACVCSECKFPVACEYKYCPNCGSVMEEVKQE